MCDPVMGAALHAMAVSVAISSQRAAVVERLTG